VGGLTQARLQHGALASGGRDDIRALRLFGRQPLPQQAQGHLRRRQHLTCVRVGVRVRARVRVTDTSKDYMQLPHPSES